MKLFDKLKGKNLEECDNMFYAYEDDLNTLNYEYIMNHKEAFM